MTKPPLVALLTSLSAVQQDITAQAVERELHGGEIHKSVQLREGISCFFSTVYSDLKLEMRM